MWTIDSSAIRSKLRRLIAAGTRTVYLVSHIGPDTDSSAADYCAVDGVMNDAGPADMKFVYKFVNAGKRYNGPVEEGAIVMHLDTGGVFDPMNFDFDHHITDCPYRSATEIVIKAFWGDRPTRPFENLMTYVNRVDSGGESDDLTDEEHELIKTANDLLQREGAAPIGRFSRNSVGPFYLAEIANYQPQDRGDKEHMKLLLGVIESYFEKLKTGTRIFREMHRTSIIARNGVRFLRFPAFDCEASSVRGFLNRPNNHDKYDVLVMEICGKAMARDNNAQYAIMYLSGKTQKIGLRGIDQVAEKLKALGLDPKKEDFYYHPKAWLIYIKEGSGLSFEDVCELAFDHIHTEEGVRWATSEETPA